MKDNKRITHFILIIMLNMNVKYLQLIYYK